MAKKHKSFKLHTKQNEMGVVMFSLLAGVIGVIIGGFLMFSETGQQVLGAVAP
ncbi:MAG: hypothetical protein US96_C0027G0011 [Candidatus Woesebacteria bacterium GW2011_GWB1_38_5b]|uniref:Uncharacterized protein n=1 Tax=Candidatus Woesebacteria bacterium GW2011_GWB1_38_5b TaxID=1618569 RepID=A0A0G0K7D7_9BACT|nr:MAG: hypothetical protein US96_C0027G0011 [Candidatus Woesebacteria bacterium GW2011_GWB1_38_5b]